MAKASVKITTVKTRTKATAPKPTKQTAKSSGKGTGQKRCSACGRYM